MKNKKSIKKLFSFVIVLALIAAAAFTFASCTDSDKTGKTNSETESSPETQAPEAKIEITVVVTDDKGTDTTFTISTSAKTLRAALEQENLIEGEESSYGLYVKVVNGVTADYDTNQAFWSFTKGGVTLNTGVDSVKISDGDHYEIKYTK